MKRIGIFLAVGLAAAVLARHFWPAQDDPVRGSGDARPNILLILADDLGNNDIGLLGDGSAQTPHMDALAKNGVRFRRHYANATCRPSRVALLTGLPSSRVGVPPNIRGISPELVTLPEALGQAGYATQHIGKWHLGHYFASAYPDQQGFDDWYGFLSALQTRHGSLQQPGVTYINPWLQHKGAGPARQQGHMTELLTNAAVEKISQLSRADQPWFINLWYLAPHTPIEPAPEFSQRFPGTAEGRYLALIAQLDYSVGRLMAALEDAGVRRNTLVVLLSDNGGANQFRNSNSPYFGKKHSFEEGGLRTPFIVNFPGRIEPSDILAPVFISDVMPTILSYAEASIPANLTGRSVVPLLAGDAVARDSQYFWDFQVLDYAKYGMLDLAEGRLVNERSIQLWDEEHARFARPATAEPSVLMQSLGLYRQWAHKTRLVDLRRERLPDGSAQLSGDSYRRTPGFGGWTLQLPMVFAADRITGVEQSGQFSIGVVGDAIEVVLPGHSFSVRSLDSGCKLLSLSSYYKWSEKKPGASQGHVSLYLAEELLYEQQFPIQPGILLDRYDPIVLSGDAAPPVISNDYLRSDLVGHYQRATGKTVNCQTEDS